METRSFDSILESAVEGLTPHNHYAAANSDN